MSTVTDYFSVKMAELGLTQETPDLFSLFRAKEQCKRARAKLYKSDNGTEPHPSEYGSGNRSLTPVSGNVSISGTSTFSPRIHYGTYILEDMELVAVLALCGLAILVLGSVIAIVLYVKAR